MGRTSLSKRSRPSHPGQPGRDSGYNKKTSWETTSTMTMTRKARLASRKLATKAARSGA